MRTFFKRLRNYIRKKQLRMDHKNYIRQKEKEAVLKYPPRWITICITNLCNNKCLFCSYHSEDAKNVSNVYNIPYKLSLPEFKRIVDMAYKGRVPKVHICGTGEPFMNDNIINMIDYAIKVYGSTSLQTNFYKRLFDKYNYLEEIVKRNGKINYITTDIMSGSPQQHNYIKKGGSYDELISSLQYISNNSDIPIKVSYVLTKQNYSTIIDLIDNLHSSKIRNCSIGISNMFTYDFNELTASNQVYTSKDSHITELLNKAVEHGKTKNISVGIPNPADKVNNCHYFWDKIQTWPVKGNIPERYQENLIPHACRAVVIGKLNSLGYIFDYKNVMDFWNNEKLVTVRRNLINGIYPDEECKYCYCYNTNKINNLKQNWENSLEKGLNDFIKSSIVLQLNKNSICIDCGANIGRVTEIFANTGAEVFSFEPNPFAFKILSKKFENNSKVNCFQKAVLNKETKVNLYMHQYNKEDNIFWSQGSSIYKTKNDVNINDFIEVETVDLIKFIKNLNKEIDILKLDIEGCEYDVLLSIINENLHNKIKHILVETHERRIPRILDKAKIVKDLIQKKNINNINFNWI